MVDFQAIKAKLSIADVAGILQPDHKVTKSGQLRLRCIACGSKSDTTVVVTPSKTLFYCFDSKIGGDQIALYAHVKGLTMKQAGDELASVIGGVPPQKVEPKNFDIDEYSAKLDVDHPAVEAIFPSELAKALGAGWATKGILKDTVAVPIRTKEGKCIGFLGLADGCKLPKEWGTP